ncbi:MAG TPA: hypothetical protein VFU81_17480, partial [Thermomicrobiales bacterium]|nr:hypothetical protein [Thermomicrobiales bacterium]
DATDNVTIDAAGLTITISSGAQAAQSLWVKAGSLALNNGSLNVSAGSEIDDTLVLNANGSLFAGGGLVNKGAVQWTLGALNLGGANAFNLGTMTLAGGVVLSSTNGANTSNLGGQFINEGTVVDQASFVTLRDSIVLNNTSLGVWEFAADTVINGGSFTPAVLNSGTFRKTVGTGNSDIQLPMTSTDGVFEAQTGTLRLANSADAFFDGAFNAAAGATVYLNSGSDGMSFSGTFTGSGAGTVLLQSGAIYLDRDATFDFAPGLFQWNNATIDLQGHTLTNSGSLALGLVNQGANENLTSRVSAQTGLGGALNNLGTIVEQGATNFYLYDNVALNNPAQGSLLFAGDGNVFVGGQAPSFITEGRIEKTSGAGLSQIAVTIDYVGGPVKVDSGTLAFDGPDGQFASANFTVAAGAVLDLTRNSDGNLLTGTFTGSGGGTVLLGSGSIVVGAGGATFDFPAGMFQWTGGGINLDGHTLTNSGSISLAASGNVSLFANSSFAGANNANLGGSLVNAGEMIQQNAGNLYLYDSVSLENQAGASYQFAGDSDLFVGTFSPTVTNAGTIEKTSGAAVSSIAVPFSNVGGTLVVDSGTLALAGRGGASTGASIQVAAGAALDLSGNTDGNIYSGTYTGAGAGNVLLQNGDFIVGVSGATFNFPDGMFQWTGGGINLFGHTLTNAGFITIANPANIALYGNGNFVGGPNTGDNKGGTLDNQGTIADPGPAAVYLYDSVLLKNEVGAVVSLTGGASLVYQNYSSAVSNAGTIEVDSGALKSTITAPLSNGGAVDVASGELDLTGVVTNSGALDARASTLKFTGAVQNAGVIQTENGVLNFSEPNNQSFAVSNLGLIQVDGGSASFTGPITQVNSGYLTGGEWAARGGGTITLPAGANVKFNEAKIVLAGAGSSIGGIEPLATNDGVFSIAAGAGFTTAGDFTNNGTLELGPGGTLSVAGDFAQAATAELGLQLGGAPASGNFGQLVVAGAAAFGGLLRSEFVNGYMPAPGDDFPAATYTSTSGAFSAAALAETPSVAYTAELGATTLVLASQAASLAPTQTKVVSSAPSGANYGQLVQYTATVSAANGTPTGAVQFQIDGVLQGPPAPLVGGQAALTLSLPAGTHTIVAFYLAGGAAFGNSDNASAPLIQIVKATSAPPASVELYYTTFSPGTVEKVSVT